MPSPFPGMDPYLEGELWQEFHNTLINAIRQQLMPKLYPNYVAMLARRYVYDSPVGISGNGESFVFYPDVHLVETEPTPRFTEGGVALAEATKVIPIAEEKVPQLTIEIRDVANRRLVTIIGVLSPANKYGKGYEEYVEKRGKLLQTRTHLLEIDLVRRGKRLMGLEGALDEPYVVYLQRFNRREKVWLWAMPLRERLPVVPVPLLPPDADVPLDLQAAVDASYAIAHYELLIDYGKKPPPPRFSEDDQRWIEAPLGQRGQHG